MKYLAGLAVTASMIAFFTAGYATFAFVNKPTVVVPTGLSECHHDDAQCPLWDVKNHKCDWGHAKD